MMVRICLECGDKGWDNAYVLCINCLEFGVHRYCLPKMPKTYDEYVSWVCDYCVEDPKRFAEAKAKAETKAKAEAEAEAEIKSISNSIAVEEESGDLNPMVVTVDHNSPPSDAKRKKKVKRVFTPKKRAKRNIITHEKEIICYHCNNKGHIKKNCSKYLELINQKIKPRNISLAQPLIDPIWRGSFNLLNNDGEALEGFVAHLSNRACQKAYEESTMIPPLLNLTLLPKSEVWPISFQKSEPTDDNIALYIFPADTRYEATFDRLVEDMRRSEFAMKATLKNAELLIFTSPELPMLYWRFQNKYYLWGVFRQKQAASTYGVKKHTFPNPRQDSRKLSNYVRHENSHVRKF